MSPAPPRRRRAPDSAEQHRSWLSLVEISGPFLSLPVLRRTWPSLDPLEKEQRAGLRAAHAQWQDDPGAGQQGWLEYVLRDLLAWGDDVAFDGLDGFTVEVGEHDTTLTPSFALTEPGEDPKPGNAHLLGLVLDPGQDPTSRIPGASWSATPVDRLALLCRRHQVELGLVTDGRWWALVWAPHGKSTGVAVFDAVAWPESAEQVVVRAFCSLLARHRFFAVPDEETLPQLLRASEAQGEEITEALGVQVRQAVELLVAAMGRSDLRANDRGESGLSEVAAHDVYRAAVSVMMRVVFLLFAEERRLLPSDNELYAESYSAGRLCAELEQRALDGSEEELENGYGAWHRLLALFAAVHHGFEHPRLTMHGHDGSLFDPEQYPWLPLTIDDRTVLHMLRAVQYVEIGTGRSKERRALSFRTLDVEQIGYVYEGLLSYDAYRAEDVVIGLIGKNGMEDEVPLGEIERHAESASDTSALAAALSRAYKDSGIGSVKAVEKRLAPLTGTDREEARKRLLAVTRGDYPLAERLLPYVGLLRTDLRGLPIVILPGGLYVTESSLRKNSGTHYTPRSLAEQVVAGALEPLVYEPGPLQTGDRTQWTLKSSGEILSLKVADIAMGSAAFLVAAARYLGEQLVQAWSNEGDERARVNAGGEDRGGDLDEDPVVIEARRQVIEHCLYGADINEMAVEMAKLSLWLVSMDPERPFTFLDDRLVAGDSLLGIRSLEQLESMHLDPKRGRELHEDAAFDWTAGVRSLVEEASSERRRIAEVEGSDTAAIEEKRSLLEASRGRTARLGLYADLLAGASLAHAKRGSSGLDTASTIAAKAADELHSGGDESEAREQQRTWLATDRVDGSFDREPLHWPLEFPEVFENGGFDAIVGNPPFLGGKKISGPLGSAYREYLVTAIGRGVKGNADLIAYFTLRAHDLLNDSGQAGLIATNTLAQGDTREVGLDQIVADGVTIRQAIKSERWPSRSAALEYSAVWTSRAPLDAGAPRFADDSSVAAIATSLDPGSRGVGQPHRLAANPIVASQGSIILGLGFTMEPEEAEKLIVKDSRNSDVLFPYLNGEDLNSTSDCSAQRWVVDFRERSEEQARTWPDAWRWVETHVKRERMKKDASKYPRMVKTWWKHWNSRENLYRAIAGLQRVIVIALVSKTVMPVMVPTGQVFAHKLGVFASDDPAMLALLSSAPHFSWTLSKSSTMKSDINYSPSDVFETFPLPGFTGELRELGDELDTYRREVMLGRELGLTKLYNLVFDETVQGDPEIDELRRIHREIDEATVRAYGWDDLLEQGLDHGFHQAGAYPRYTIGPVARQEILDRLLELNHARYAEEVAAGLHEKKKSSAKRATKGTSKGAGKPADPDTDALF